MSVNPQTLDQTLHKLAVRFHAPSVTKETVKMHAKEARNIVFTEQEKALSRIFGATELESLQMPEHEMGATNLFLPLLREIFDMGSATDLTCQIPYEGKKISVSERAVPIHTRSSFISTVLKEEENINKGSLSLARIDLERFRNADFDIKDPHGVRPADILINTTARTIRDVLKDVWNGEIDGKKLDYKTDSYELGRYGGDELIIAFAGEKAQEKKGEAMKLIIERLAHKIGYYKNETTGAVNKLPIMLKKDKITGSSVEWISFPKLSLTNNELTMYKEYLQRGLILNEEDFQKEKKKYQSSSNGLDFEAYRQDYPEGMSIISYPPDKKTTGEKIAYLSGKHPELAFYFDLAKIFDEKEKEMKELPQEVHLETRQQKLLTIIENSIFDKLLGDMIYTRPHFIEHIGKGDFKEIYMYDFKFLKEKNGAMTYADADESIKMLWNNIQDTFSESDRNKLVVSRFAGAIYIGVKKNNVLSNKCIEKLNRIRSLGFSKNNEYTVPLGFAYINYKSIDLPPDLPPDDILRILENSSNKEYYVGLIHDIEESMVGNPRFLTEMIDVDIEQLKKRKYKSLSKLELYALFLRGQRMVARTNTLMQIAENDNELKNNNTYISLRNLLSKEVKNIG